MKRAFTTILGFALFVILLLPSGADAITVSPPNFDYSLNPGDSVLDVIKIRNEGSGTEVFYPVLMNFGADQDEAGTPQFYSPDEDRMGQGLAQWITVDPAPIVLEAGERTDVKFSINVPEENVQPGGHYGAIMISSAPADPESGTVGVASQLATIILVRISGEVNEVGSIAEFGFSDPQIWYNHLPIDFFMRFENAGNTHLRPTGNLIITDWLGRKVETLKVNSPEYKSVLPMSIRKFGFGWHKGPLNDEMSGLRKEWHNFGLGKYKAQLIINYGLNNQIIIDEREFFVWPWRLMTAAGVGLLVLLILLTFFKHFYDKSVMKKYERMQKKARKK
ncbi:MAG: hypothetical protein U9Q03_03020 [Patescibacteria group bacterium]|nr:hypothetical protein [Patescibacteria group bacterium]